MVEVAKFYPMVYGFISLVEAQMPTNFTEDGINITLNHIHSYILFRSIYMYEYMNVRI